MRKREECHEHTPSKEGTRRTAQRAQYFVRQSTPAASTVAATDSQNRLSRIAFSSSSCVFESSTPASTLSSVNASACVCTLWSGATTGGVALEKKICTGADTRQHGGTRHTRESTRHTKHNDHKRKNAIPTPQSRAACPCPCSHGQCPPS